MDILPKFNSNLIDKSMLHIFDNVNQNSSIFSTLLLPAIFIMTILIIFYFINKKSKNNDKLNKISKKQKKSRKNKKKGKENSKKYKQNNNYDNDLLLPDYDNTNLNYQENTNMNIDNNKEYSNLEYINDLKSNNINDKYFDA